MLSDRAKNWIRKRAEKFIDAFYEGEEPPSRLREQVIVFANLHPNATRGAWVSFAADFAEQVYRAGYLRGVEWAERDVAALNPNVPPETVADQIDPDWRWRPSVVLELPEWEQVPERYEHHQAVRDQVSAINRRERGE